MEVRVLECRSQEVRAIYVGGEHPCVILARAPDLPAVKWAKEEHQKDPGTCVRVWWGD